jgi:hypothetical protein
MTPFFDAVRWVHIGAGALALVCMWLPIASRKGSALHVRTGWAYVIAMALVAITAIAMAAVRIVDPQSSETDRAFALFLSSISALAAASTWFGVRVWRFRDRRGPHRNPIDLGFAVVLAGSGIVVMGLGIWKGSALLALFPLLGVFLGVGQLRYWLGTPRNRHHVWFAHMTAMFAASISTVTAFVVFGAPRLLALEVTSPLLWFAPTLVLVPVLVWWRRHYRAQFASAEQREIARDARGDSVLPED